MNKVDKDCNNFIEYMFTMDDDLYDIIHKKESITLKTFEKLIWKSYQYAIDENGIRWNDFSSYKPTKDPSDETRYLVKRFDSSTNKLVIFVSVYDEDDWKNFDILEWAYIDHLY